MAVYDLHLNTGPVQIINDTQHQDILESCIMSNTGAPVFFSGTAF